MFFDNSLLVRIRSIEHDIAYRTDLPQTPVHPNHPDSSADGNIISQYKKDCDTFIKQISQYEKQINYDCALLKKQLSIWKELIIELAHTSTAPESKNRKNLNDTFEKVIDINDIFNKISSRNHVGIQMLTAQRELFLSKIRQ